MSPDFRLVAKLEIPSLTARAETAKAFVGLSGNLLSAQHRRRAFSCLFARLSQSVLALLLLRCLSRTRRVRLLVPSVRTFLHQVRRRRVPTNDAPQPLELDLTPSTRRPQHLQSWRRLLILLPHDHQPHHPSTSKYPLWLCTVPAPPLQTGPLLPPRPSPAAAAAATAQDRLPSEVSSTACPALSRTRRSRRQ